MKALIVEYQERPQQFLKQSLSDSTHPVSWVRGCVEANNAMAETRFNAIVLDLGLPDDDGRDLLCIR
jgi:DNA-binding response OmpR family regulator